VIFSAKLDGLIATLELVANKDQTALGRAVSSGKMKPAFAIGSGGSAATAYYFQRCRETVDAAYTCVQTPLEFTLGQEHITDSQVWLFSARGENPDVLAAYESAIARGADTIHIVISCSGSTLEKLSNSAPNVNLHVVPVSDPKDGFLATHSMIAAIFSLLLAADRCSGSEVGTRRSDAFLCSARHIFSAANRSTLTSSKWQLTDRKTLILLADPRLSAATTVIETSLWETAICAVQTTDFRNFAHGRHVWLAHRGIHTNVIALTGSETQAIWDDLSAVVPDYVTRHTIGFGNAGRFQAALATLEALVVVEQLGRAIGIDPAKPGVGSFARSIYEATSLQTLSTRLNPSVRQKAASLRLTDDADLKIEDLETFYEHFLNRLATARFEGLVLDYDGTVVATSERWDAPRPEIIEQLVRLLKAGLQLAIATGRGSSVGRDLRLVIPVEFHSRILIGYYNGTYIQTLEIDIKKVPPQRLPEIENAYAWLCSSGFVKTTGDQKVKNSRGQQITASKHGINSMETFNEGFDAYNKKTGSKLKQVQSQHSVDICLASACKTDVVQAIAEKIGKDEPTVLCIGDSGRSGGNDHVLLGSEFGISVGDVCHRAERCWSLFGDTKVGPDALIRIFRALDIAPAGKLQLQMDKLEHDK